MNLSQLIAMAADLCEQAQDAGLVLRIDVVANPMQPLAMGNRMMQIDAYPGRCDALSGPIIGHPEANYWIAIDKHGTTTFGGDDREMVNEHINDVLSDGGELLHLVGVSKP